MSEMVKRVGEAMEARRPDLIAQPLARIWPELAEAAVRAMRDLPTEMQMAGCEGQILYATGSGLFAALPHYECVTPDHWMARGASMGKRMMSGDEFMAGWNAALDAILDGAAA